MEKNDDFQIEVAPAPDALDARARYPAAEPRAGCRKRSSEPRGARVRVTGLGDRVDRSNRPRSPGLRLAVRPQTHEFWNRRKVDLRDIRAESSARLTTRASHLGSRGRTREGEEETSAMAVAGGLKLDGRLLILASAVFTASLLLLVFGISHGRREQSGDKLVDFAYLGLLFRSVNPYFFAALGIAAAIGFSVLGAAWCVFRASRRTRDPSASKGPLARPRDARSQTRAPLSFSSKHERAFVFYPTSKREKAKSAKRFRLAVSSRTSHFGLTSSVVPHARANVTTNRLAGVSSSPVPRWWAPPCARRGSRART